MTDADTELVSILVPKRHLGRVYGFVSTLDDHSASPEAPVSDPDPQPDNGHVEEAKKWPPELVRRQFAESPKSIKNFQRLLAGHPGEWFSTSEIASRLNAVHGSKSIAGALGAYGRRTSNRYKMKGWPFQVEWNHVEGQCYYSMEPWVAEIIKSL